MLRHWTILAGIGALFAAPLAHAGTVFTPPSGCTLNMTVQMRSCQVANYYTCAGDPAGDQWISFADGEGEYFLSHIDAETRWVESVSLYSGELELLDAEGSADNASFSALLSEGRDEYDFVTRSNTGEAQRFIGLDELTGEATSVDGVPLEYCRFEMRIEDDQGNYQATRKGMQLISRKMRVFFGATEDYQNSYGDRSSSNDTPVSFAFPGEAGFAAATPEYDCDMMLTDLSPLLDHPSKEVVR
ncbi:hypothetical protein SAMN05877809_104282 [Rhodobacter sp. JA431]|uniref:hypothetical protein n=1 Tax=Rhodobacter sp. JA431 TaxID=570013 RepID=UPI000BD17EED|nr:hypothetical protein [Rhodobacter sp. JA431]SOC08340.1 hypothetical protein SAMN05877809_104282 [Rhodobacter sp. JA431]